MIALRWLRVAALAAGLAACGGDDEPTLENLSGQWSATRMEFTGVDNPADQVDVIALGATFDLNLNDSGGFAGTLTFPGEAPETITGTWSYTSDTLTLQEDDEPFALVFDMDLGNDTMTLSGADVEFDVDDDGVDEPATLTIVLVRD